MPPAIEVLATRKGSAPSVANSQFTELSADRGRGEPPLLGGAEDFCQNFPPHAASNRGTRAAPSNDMSGNRSLSRKAEYRMAQTSSQLMPQLTTGEILEVLMVFTLGASGVAPAYLQGPPPLTPLQVGSWRRRLAGRPSSPLRDTVLSALDAYETFASPVIARRRVLDAALRWKSGAELEALQHSLAEISWAELEARPEGRRRVLQKSQLRDVGRRLRRCVEAIERVRYGAEAPACRRQRRGRMFRAMERDLHRLQTWLDLPDAAATFLRERRPADTARLRSMAAELTERSLSPQLRQAAEQLDDDLVELERLPLELHEERGDLLARVRLNLETLGAAPPPMSRQAWERRQKQLATLARRWSEAGRQITAERLQALAASMWDEAGLIPSMSLATMAALHDAASGPSSFAAAGRVAALLGDWPAPTSAHHALTALKTACGQVGAAVETLPHDADELVVSLARRWMQFAAWLEKAGKFVESRLASTTEEHLGDWDTLLHAGRFAIAPPDRRDRDALAGWLALLPASQRQRVLELLSVGPVRTDVRRAALTIAQVEMALRREPRAKPAQLAELAVAVELADPELAKLLRREMFYPALAEKEQAAFRRRRKTIWRWLRSSPDASEARRRLLRRVPTWFARFDPATGAPFFAPRYASPEARQRAQRRGALELFHSLWRLGVVDEPTYRLVLAQHWRRPATLDEKLEADRRRSSLLEVMMHYVRQTHLAAADGREAPPSTPAMILALWRYLQSDAEIAQRWAEYTPDGVRRCGRGGSPARVEADDPFELIEHIVQRVVAYFDLEGPLAALQAWAALPPKARPRIPERELHEVRLVALLLFEMFGDAGALLPPQVYAWSLAEAVQDALAALTPLADADAEAQQACRILTQLQAFLEAYEPWSPPLSFTPWADGARQSLARWRELLERLQATAGAMSRAPHFAGNAALAWQATERLLGNQQSHRRLQLALRVAVERDDPTCRHLCSAKTNIPQMVVERLGLGQRRRLHPRSEARIIANKLQGRIAAVADELGDLRGQVENESVKRAVEALIFHGQQLWELHQKSLADPAVREQAARCRAHLQWWRCRLRTLAAADGSAWAALKNHRLLEAVERLMAVACDFVDGYCVPQQHRGLRTLIPLRQGDALDDTLSRD